MDKSHVYAERCPHVCLCSSRKRFKFLSDIRFDQSGERACAMWEQSVFSVQMAGKRSKEFGADELEAWPSQFLVPKGIVAIELAEICTVWLHSFYTAKNCHIICN